METIRMTQGEKGFTSGEVEHTVCIEAVHSQTWSK
jgi:hypothetical protein